MTTTTAARPAWVPLLALAGAVSFGTACDQIQALIGGGGPEVVAEANNALKSGDLPGAAAQYQELATSNGSSVHVAIGQAYSQLLRGDTAGADATLAGAEANAGDKLPEVKLRRALVALEAGDLDNVKAHGTASGLPEGKLLAAEVLLTELESDEASAILREITGTEGAVGSTASTYLQMLDSGDQIQAGLAEATALWALGDRAAACESAEELVKALPEDDETKPALILLWAGRAATSGKPGVGSSLLEDMSFPPDGQAWRIQATRAIIAAAEGKADESIKILASLEAGGAPADGLADARATACGLITDKPKAREVVGELESPAVARCLSEAGAVQVAPLRAPPGPLKTYLENQQ